MFRSLLRDGFCHSTSRFFEGFNTPQKSAGFTLIEVMVSLAVFLIIMTAVSQTFTQSFSSYKNTRAVQRDTENAQFALSLMAKELRTSTITIPSSGSLVNVQTVRFYDYSQNTCFEYEIALNQLTVRKKLVGTPSGDPSVDCNNSGTWSTPTPIAQAKQLTGQFIVTPSKKAVPKSVGKVTVSLQISEGPNHTARIQTTSSLRDYGYVGI